MKKRIGGRKGIVAKNIVTYAPNLKQYYSEI